MTGRTNYTAPANSGTFEPPADMAAIYKWFDDRLDLSVANAAGLPSSGNWKGRRVITEDTGIQYWNTDGGTSWKRVTGGLKVALSKNIAQSSVVGNATISWSSTGAAVDIGGFYSTSQPTRLTAPATGVYAVQVNVGASATSSRSLGWNKNGAAQGYFAANMGGAGAASHVFGQLILPLNSADYIEVYLLDSSATTINADLTTNISMELIA